MMRTWADWYAAAQAASQGSDRRASCWQRGGSPLWPDEAAVSLWTLPARELAVTSFQLL